MIKMQTFLVVLLFITSVVNSSLNVTEGLQNNTYSDFFRQIRSQNETNEETITIRDELIAAERKWLNDILAAGLDEKLMADGNDMYIMQLEALDTILMNGVEPVDLRWDCTLDTPDDEPCANLVFGENWRKMKWEMATFIGTDTAMTGWMIERGPNNYHPLQAKWNFHDEYPETQSSWFTHPDFKDPDGNQKYYYLQKRNGLTDVEIECKYLSYTDTNTGNQIEISDVRMWCPESQEEMEEVYAHTINDIDSDFLSNDFYYDKSPTQLGGLPIMQLLAKWIVYTESILSQGMKNPDFHGKIFPVFHSKAYNRFNIMTGIQLKNGHKPSEMYFDDSKTGLKCKDDPSWASRIQSSADFNNKKIFRGNGKYEKESEYWHDNKGFFLDYIDHDDIWYRHQVSPAACSRVGMIIDHFGKPAENNNSTVDGTDFRRWTWKIKTEASRCDIDVMKNSRPMCVVSGDSVPQAVKNQSIDIKYAGPMAHKIIKRQNEIQQMLDEPRKTATAIKVYISIAVVVTLAVFAGVGVILFKKLKSNKVEDDENQNKPKINMDSSLQQVSTALENTERELLSLRTIHLKLKRKKLR